jgi:hypothetical protein
MTNTASRQKSTSANANVNSNMTMNKSAKTKANATTNTDTNKTNVKNANAATIAAAVKPASAKATAAVKQTATLAAAPTRAVQSAGANANTNTNGKNVVNNKASANAAAKGNKIGKTNQPVTANANVKNANATNNGNNSRVNGAQAANQTGKPKSASAGKTNAKTTKGKAQTNAKATKGKTNAKPESNTVGASFVLRLVLGLAPEKRADCQLLREILSHESHARLLLTPSGKGLKPASGGSAAANAKDWAKLSQDQRRQMARQTQSAKFQEAMQQLGGERLYASIRTLLGQASDEFVWDASKDKPALQQAKAVRPRPGSADYKSKSKGKSCEVSKEAAKWSQVPPPAPVGVKSSPVKKDAALKTSGQAKNAPPVKNGGTPVKNVSAAVAWGGATPASVVQSRPGAIVSSAPTFSARGGIGGRAILSRAL